jgi:hypothetical protein
MRVRRARRTPPGARHTARPASRPAATAALVAAVLAAAAGGPVGCSGAQAGAAPRDAAPPRADGRLFTRLPSSYTGVTFANRVADTPEQNVFTYRNHYNGGGVAVGDLTGDGLPEVVLTANQGGAALYLNEGHFRFRDVTRAAGIRGGRGWTTGVTLADVDGDGRLDLYVSHAGTAPGASRANELWINRGPGADGVPRFSEEAARFGVADTSYTTQAAFFDFDRDGDLDLFLLNNAPRPVGGFGERNTRTVRDPLGGDKLLRNDGGRFVDVSARAGIYGGESGFGLGVVASDVDGDGWPDLYVSNDYHERDYLYLNNRDGTFREAHEHAFSVGSYFSMGLDVADVDNDGRPDVYTTDMLPEDEARLKTTTSFDGWDVYQAKVRTGYGHQLMRNMLHLNNGDGTFREVGQMAGVARTDWSWSALVADFDLDGRKDVFVANGIARDMTSQDYVAYLADQATARAATAGGRVDFLRLVQAMPSTPLANYAFRNAGGAGADLAFVNASAAWGLDTPSFSNGAAYGDLDGDGAPDLVVNNENQEAFVYRNNARAVSPDRHYLALRLEGAGKNRFAVGARVTVWAGGERFYQESQATRGFQSSVDPVLTFGLGAHARADSVRVDWPDGRASALRDVAADRRLTVDQRGAGAPPAAPAPAPGARLVADATAAAAIPFVHRENAFVDFDRDRLIPKMLSTEGPALAVADVNGDGLDDLYLGGAKDQAGSLLVQQRDGRFVSAAADAFAADAISEDVGALFFDANGDGRPDLYVVSGGNEFGEQAPALQDRLYLNDGAGRFHKAADAIPAETAAGSRAAAADVDGDGDVDLFVGARAIPWRYGVPPRSALLVNDGRGHFADATDRLAPALAGLGMVTDAAWRDVDGDRRPDLVVVGDWMPITVLRNAGGGRLVPRPAPGLERSRGWWNRVVAGDFTGDGRVDFVVANLGLNSRLRASPAEPATMHVKDFDGNGIVEQIVSTFAGGASYPVTQRDDLLRSLPHLRARFPGYASYARKGVADVFDAQELSGAVVDTAETFASALVRNDGGGRFTVVPLPREAQVAPAYALVAHDLDGDGALDLLLAGNFDGVKPEVGRLHAGAGLALLNDGRGAFRPVPPNESGFRVPGQARDAARVRTAGGAAYVVARNDDRPLVFRPTPPAARVAARRAPSPPNATRLARR